YIPVDAMVHPRFAGIRSFMRLPHVTELATDVDFAIVGVPFDTGGTFRVGARFGPAGVRENSLLLRPYNPAQKILIFDQLSGVDYGDLQVIPGYLPESHNLITSQATAICESPATPIFIGGDHSVSLPLLRAAYKVHGPLALVHFDAHSDLWLGYYGDKDTHGTPFRRAVEEGLLKLEHSIQIGLRGPLFDHTDYDIGQQLGIALIDGPELHEIGMAQAIGRIRETVDSAPAYLTFDIDFIDPAFAPGTGTPEVGGFSGYDAIQLVRGLAGLDIRAYDLVEVMPPYDPANITSLLAANIIYEFITLIALQKQQNL
ncbi:MAG: agmatinase, partial [Saprospiraceae bacterium]|nr:agmatinase [Saprospiraceae bacterium]